MSEPSILAGDFGPMPQLRIAPVEALRLPASRTTLPVSRPRGRWASAALRLVLSLVIGTVLGLAGGLVLVVAGPQIVGGRALTVMSGSMSPAIETGDIIVTRGISPLDARIGDVVTFRDPESQSRLLTHRVTDIRYREGDVAVTTKGDANTKRERWVVSGEGRIGRVVLRLPKLGYVVALAGSPSGRILLLMVPALLLAFLGLKRIWSEPSWDGRR
jgi:signal peptidase